MYAEGSRRNLRIQVESLLLSCLYFSLQYLPVSTCMLKFWEEHLSRLIRLGIILAVLKTFHSSLGFGVDISS